MESVTLISNYMEYTSEQFSKIKEDAEKFYNTIDKIKCPYFDGFVFFNAKGLDHLKLKSWNKARSQQDQYGRFRHIKLAVEVVGLSKTLQGFSSSKKLERIKTNKKWQMTLKTVTFYEFIAVLESHGSLVRVKIVVKEIEGGEKFFWSLIPFWGVDKGNGRVLSMGNPEQD